MIYYITCHIVKPCLIFPPAHSTRGITRIDFARNQTEQHCEILNQHLDHDYYQYNKDSSALEDPTCDNTNFGGLGFHPQRT